MTLVDPSLSDHAGRADPDRLGAALDRLAAAHSRVFVLAGAAIAAVAVAVRWAGGWDVNTGATLPVLAAVALIAGLPHGALDPWISHRAGLWRGVSGFVRWHAIYVAIAAAVVVAFLVAPSLALFGFLALSVYHFSGDWNGEEAGFRALPRGLRLVAATTVVIVPSVAHPEAVATIFAAIMRSAPPAGPIDLPYGIMLPTLWLLAGTIGAAWWIDRRAGLEIAVVVALAVALPPLAFFLAYFAGLHSPRHMLRERDAVPGGRAMLGVLFYTLLALGLCAGVTVWAFGGELEALASGADGEVLRAVFIGLAALTLPHVLLVERASHGYRS